MSAFSELFSDFQDAVKIYTAKLDVTELSFMRLLTQGIQTFQRETEYVEAYAAVQKDANNRFYMPNDAIRIVEVKDDDGYTFVMQGYDQYTRNLERWQDGYLETPTDYSMYMPRYLSGKDDDNINPNAMRSSITKNKSRLITIWNRRFLLHPDLDDKVIHVWYIPDLQPISRLSTQWVADPANPGSDPNDWFPEQNFDVMFRNSSVNPTIAPYEKAFCDYAKAEFIKSQGSANYKIFEIAFWSEINRAKNNKPVKYKEAVRSYMMAPKS